METETNTLKLQTYIYINPVLLKYLRSDVFIDFQVFRISFFDTWSAIWFQKQPFNDACNHHSGKEDYWIIWLWWYCNKFVSDLKKSFDAVSHPIRTKKLYAYGIGGNVIKLGASYLKNRTQFVAYDGQGRKSMFKHGGDNIGGNIHLACGMYCAALRAALSRGVRGHAPPRKFF